MTTKKKQIDIDTAESTEKANIEDSSSNIHKAQATISTSTKSLTASLQRAKKKPVRVRFTLDLDKTLDSRLSKAATQLNRSKADLTRIALEMLLDQLEKEWDN